MLSQPDICCSNLSCGEKKHKYYKKHIEDISYYSDFEVFILDEELCKNKIEENYFQVVDCNDAIEEFKYLIQPTKDYREKYKNVKFISDKDMPLKCLNILYDLKYSALFYFRYIFYLLLSYLYTFYI